MKHLYLSGFAILFLLSCKGSKVTYDTSGTFEAVETIISSEASGILTSLNLEEGQLIKSGQIVGYIDSTQLVLTKKKLEAQVQAVLGKSPEVSALIAANQSQLEKALHEQARNVNLIKDGGITGKQMDDANAQVELSRKQLTGLKSSLSTTRSAIEKETIPLLIQMEQVNDQLQKCRLNNRVSGTVLAKYVEQSEVVAPGQPLYKIADLSRMILRAYITDQQLANIKIGQKVSVLIQSGPDQEKKYQGTIEWVSSKAEFTPKTIQTKEERANLVYPIKIRVNNDGYLKIGMYADVMFQS